MKSIKNLFKKSEVYTIHRDGTEYCISATSVDDQELVVTFRTRKSAREFKRLLRESNCFIEYKIIQRVWDDNFLLVEREVW